MADKTLGDYGVEAQKAMASNTVSGLPPIIAEMRAALPPEPYTPPTPPAPVNQGLKAYVDQLDACVASSNVFQASEIAKEMIAVDPPTPPPAPAEPAP